VGVRARGGIVIVVAHRTSALAGVDQLMVMTDGRVQALGQKDVLL
jgi:ATP-binding cassette subfamily C protein